MKLIGDVLIGIVVFCAIILGVSAFFFAFGFSLIKCRELFDSGNWFLALILFSAMVLILSIMRGKQ